MPQAGELLEKLGVVRIAAACQNDGRRFDKRFVAVTSEVNADNGIAFDGEIGHGSRGAKLNTEILCVLLQYVEDGFHGGRCTRFIGGQVPHGVRCA